MKLKIKPKNTLIALKFKSKFIPVEEAESQLEALRVQLENQNKEIGVRLIFDDGVMKYEYDVSEFSSSSSTNLMYYAIKMIDEKYGTSPEEAKAAFLKQIEGTQPKAPKKVETKQKEQLSSDVPTIICKNCEEAIPVYAEFCPFCGFYMQEEEETQPERNHVDTEMVEDDSDPFAKDNQESRERQEPSSYETVPPIASEVESVDVFDEPPVEQEEQVSEAAPLWLSQVPQEVQDIISRGKNFKGKASIREQAYAKYKSPKAQALEEKKRELSSLEEKELAAARVAYDAKVQGIKEDYQTKNTKAIQEINAYYVSLIEDEIIKNLESERQKVSRFASDMERTLQTLIETT